MQALDRDFHTGRCERFHIGAESFPDFVGVLLRDEAHGDLGGGVGGDDGFGAFADVAAVEAVDIQGGADGGAF